MFSFQIQAINAPTHFVLKSGTLPAGIVLNSTTGLISGTYTGSTMTGTLSIEVSNTFGVDTQNITFKCGKPPVITNGDEYVTGNAYENFAFQIATTGEPTLYELLNDNAANFASGLHLNTSTGLISGYYTGTGGNLYLEIKVSNSFGEDTKIFQGYLMPLEIPVITSSEIVPTFIQGTPFIYQIEATHNPTSFSVENLAAGLIFNSSTGLISGTPTTDVLSMKVKATNQAGTGVLLLLKDTVAPADVVTFSYAIVDKFSFNLQFTLAYPNDNVGGTMVEIYKNNVYYSYTPLSGAGNSGGGSRLIQNLTPGSTATWKVRVKDGQGNYSNFTNELTVTMPEA